MYYVKCFWWREREIITLLDKTTMLNFIWITVYVSDHSWSRRINFVCEQVNRATRIIQETKSVLPKGAKRAGLVESIKDN